MKGAMPGAKDADMAYILDLNCTDRTEHVAGPASPEHKRGDGMNRIWGLFSLAGLAALSGCATMSGEECATADWAAVGYEDGANGYPTERLGDHRKACAKHGYTPDFAAYRQGREQGLVEYCQTGRGFKAGESGANYHGVCPPELEEDFLSGYRIGHHLHTLRSAISDKSSDIHRNERNIKKLEEDIRDKEAVLANNELNSDDRRDLLDEIKRMSERMGRLKADIDLLVVERSDLRAELRQLEESLPDFSY
jgi:hypothetical protein